MSIDQLLNQFIGGQANNQGQQGTGISGGITGGLNGLADKIPGGAVGGLAAGGLLGILVGNKKVRKTAGKALGGAATIGGAALLGAAAYTAYKNWKGNSSQSGPQNGGAAANNTPSPTPTPPPQLEQIPATEIEHAGFNPATATTADGQPLQVTLIKAMIAAANADGHIDKDEQARIFDTVNTLDLDVSDKALVFDTLQNPPSVSEIAALSSGLEQASEIYIASRLAIDPDNEMENQYLSHLVMMLQLPDDLVVQLEDQIRIQMG